MTHHSMPLKELLLFDCALLAMCFFVLAGCDSRDQGSSDTRRQVSSSGVSSVPIIPRDPRGTLQPLAPGYTWTYAVRARERPKVFRWFSKDGKSGSGFSVVGLFATMDGRGAGDYRVKFTVLNETIALRGAGQDKFYKVSMTDAVSGTDMTNGETLYWGRYRYDSPLDLAVCELRAIGPAAIQILEQAPYYPEDFSAGRYHFRYLTGDYLFDWPQPGQVTAGTMTLSEPDRWEAKTTDRLETISVPAGTFEQVVPTTFRFSFSGRTENWVTETLYYKPGIGLVKWVQAEDGNATVIGELMSYEAGQ